MAKLLEQDLEPVEDTQETPELPIDDLDLEEVLGGEEEEGVDYQYTLTVKKEEDEADTKNLEPSFTFILKPKEEEGEEMDGDLEAIEDASAGIEGAQAPQASVTPGLPESVMSDLEPITEQEAPISAAGGENTPPAMEAPAEAPAPMPEEEPELEDASGTEFTKEDFKSFMEGSEIEMKFSIDEETEFTVEEALDYLELYPDTEVFVTVKGDVEEFKKKLEEYTSGKASALETAATEEQNVMVNNEGETLDLKNTPSAPASPSAPKESFSIFNIKNKPNLPDGIYVGHIAENKLYGRIDLKLTPDKLIIDKDVFSLKTQINITEAKATEEIKLSLKDEDVVSLVATLQEKADITINLDKV